MKIKKEVTFVWNPISYVNKFPEERNKFGGNFDEEKKVPPPQRDSAFTLD
jgi:hypothetical protein